MTDLAIDPYSPEEDYCETCYCSRFCVDWECECECHDWDGDDYGDED